MKLLETVPAGDPGRGTSTGVPAPVSLGNNADFAESLQVRELQSTIPAPGTVVAYYLRSVGRSLLKSQGIERRMRWCGSKISPCAHSVSVFGRPDRLYGRVGGVCVCGQSVCCPVCAPRIAAFRSEEVGKAFDRMLDAGFEPRLETFTKPHVLDRRPGALMREFREFSDLWRSFGKNQEGFNIVRAVGSHLGREVTWGDRHGWHYHHHRLRYDKPDTFNGEVVKAGWLATLEGRGLRTEGADEHAYRCDVVGHRTRAMYCAKLATSVEAEARAVGREVSSSATKGRNINTLLRHFAAGDQDAGNQWVNGVSCVTATKVSSVRWSRGLRHRVGLENDRADEEIAAEEVTPGDVCLGYLRPWQWRVIIEGNCELALLCAANGGREKCDDFLAGISAGHLLEDEPEVSESRF